MAVTYTLAITDRYSSTIFTRASLAESTTYNIFSDKYGGTAEYSPLRTPLSGNLTLTITSDVATTGTFYGTVYVEENGIPGAHKFSVTFAHPGTTTGTDTIYCGRGYLVGIVTIVAALPSASLSPSASISPSSSKSPSKSPSESPSRSPSESPSTSPSESSSQSPSRSPSSSNSPSNSPSLSPSTSISPSSSLSPSSSNSPSLSPSTSISPSLSPSLSPSSSESPSASS